METKNYNMTILTASEGHWLTQAAEVDIAERALERKVAVGSTDSPANWREIDETEAAAIRAEKQRLERETD